MRKRWVWWVSVAVLGLVLSVGGTLFAACFGRVVGRDKPLMVHPDATHWGLVPHNAFGSHSRDSTIYVTRAIDGQTIPLAVSAKTWQRKRVGSYYYGEW